MSVRRRVFKPKILAPLLLLIPGGVFLYGVGAAPVPQETELAGFATSLRGRTAGQRHNAQKAAEALDGKIIAPGETFSFNKTVKSWSWDAGYVKAPVSYDGELVRAYGGGVCQTSTTLYNAALLAGLPIVERHAHTFAPHYVPPGRDAAVAQYDIDLRFRNPYLAPLRLRVRADGDRLEARIFGAERQSRIPQIATEILSAETPNRLVRIVTPTSGGLHHGYIRNPGAIGYRVVSYRVFMQNGKETRRERLGDDTYQAMDRVVNLPE